jgi:broad specificity phosphatase PhoE
MTDALPEALWVVRHGESAGNLASTAAEEAGEEELELAIRDPDVPLSPLGAEQAAAVGRWLGGLPAGEQPTVALSSPYVRARETLSVALDTAGLADRIALTGTDERLRERDLGAFDGLTLRGIEARYPAEWQRRSRLGKLYYRPPGGESWCDVALRVRAFLDTARVECPDERILVVTHEAVALCFRYVLERLDEKALYALGRPGAVPNAAFTAYRRSVEDRGRAQLALVAANDVGHLAAVGVPATEEPGAAARLR